VFFTFQNGPKPNQLTRTKFPGRGRGRGRGEAKTKSPGSVGYTPNKSAELARLRQLAKLRREIQKNSTDILELEMAELCEVKAYLSACNRGSQSNEPYGRVASPEDAQAATREALEKAVVRVSFL